MDRTRATAWITGAAIAVLLVAATSAGGLRLAEAPPSLPWTFEPGSGTTIELSEIPVFEEPDDADVEPLEIPQAISQLVIIALIALVCLAVLLIARTAWRNRPRLQWRKSQESDFDVLDEVASRDEIAAALSADADAQRVAVRRGTPRNGIVECWLRLESVIADAGLERSPASTSSEFTAAVLSSFPVDRTAIHRLAALYREARFSSHHMGESARAAAIDALRAVHDGLDRERASRVPTS